MAGIIIFYTPQLLKQWKKCKSSKIEFSLSKSEFVRIEIYNLIGQKVKTLIDRYMLTGKHNIEFNAQQLASGIYFYRAVSNVGTVTGKMLLMR